MVTYRAFNGCYFFTIFVSFSIPFHNFSLRLGNIRHTITAWALKLCPITLIKHRISHTQQTFAYMIFSLPKNRKALLKMPLTESGHQYTNESPHDTHQNSSMYENLYKYF